jgi:hypothetical protein
LLQLEPGNWLLEPEPHQRRVKTFSPAANSEAAAAVAAASTAGSVKTPFASAAAALRKIAVEVAPSRVAVAFRKALHW